MAFHDSRTLDKFRTSSGIPLKSYYTPDDVPLDDEKPGEYPFTRGIYPTMYRGRLWTMRQYAGYASAEESNARYRFLLEQGQSGLSVAFDLPTQIGYDADDPMALGEVGKVGVSISSLRDMERLFEGIPLDKVSTSMTINAPAAVLLAMYIAVGKRQGVESTKLRGTVQNDILKEYIARGTYIYPPKAVDAPDHRPVRLLQDDVPQLEHHQHQRLPHPRGGQHRRAGGRLHAGERHRLRAGGARRRAGRGRLRAAAFVLLQRAQPVPRRSRQVPRRAQAVGDHHARALRRDTTRKAGSCASTRRPAAAP